MGAIFTKERKKQTNKVELISNMSLAPKRKKTKLLLPIIQSPWNMGGKGNTQLDFGHI
jgi:hypothetical protein